MSVKARTRLVLAGLAAVGIAAVAADVVSFALPAPSAKQQPHGGVLAVSASIAACPRQHDPNPYHAAATFIHSTVTRTKLAQSYDLASPTLRGNVSCAQWEHGRVPLQKLTDVDWSHSGFQVVGTRSGEVMLRVVLTRRSGGAATFLVDMKKENGGWRVQSLQPNASSLPGA